MSIRPLTWATASFALAAASSTFSGLECQGERFGLDRHGRRADVTLGQRDRQRRQGNLVAQVTKSSFQLLDPLAHHAKLFLGFQQVLHGPFAVLDDVQQPLLHHLGCSEDTVQIRVFLGDILGGDLLAACQVADSPQLEHQRIQMLPASRLRRTMTPFTFPLASFSELVVEM